MSAVNLLDFDLDGLTAFCEQLGEKRFRATQLFRWIHQKGATDFDQMSDLAKSLRSKLKGVATLQDLSVISEHVSSDGTIKWLFDVGAGNAVESVYIPESDRGTPGKGNVRWDEVFAALAAIGFDGGLAMESFINMPEDLAWGLSVWRPVADSADEVITEGLPFLRGKARQYGLIDERRGT